MNRKGNLLTFVVIILTVLTITVMSLSSLINILTKQDIYTKDYIKEYEGRRELFEQIYSAICSRQTFVTYNDLTITLQPIAELQPQPYNYDSNNNPVYLPEPLYFSYSFYSDFYLPFTDIQAVQGLVIFVQENNNQKTFSFIQNQPQITVPSDNVAIYLPDWQPYYKTAVYEVIVKDKDNRGKKFYFIKYNNKIVFVF